MEVPLTLDHRFRLVVIAHETKDEEVKRAAITLLAEAIHPLSSLNSAQVAAQYALQAAAEKQGFDWAPYKKAKR